MVSSMIAVGVSGATAPSNQVETGIETDGQAPLPSADPPESDEEAGPETDQNGTIQSQSTEIIVENVDDLQAIQNNPNADVILRNDIDASETEQWNDGKGFEPIGDSITPFTGSFDGRGYTIENLTIDRPNEDNVGLFGYAGDNSGGDDATIKNVRLENAEITGGSQTGGIVGTLEEDRSGNSLILNTSVTGEIEGSGTYAGGIVGFPTGGGSGEDAYGPLLDEENRFSGTVTGDQYVGGLIGRSNFGTEMGVGYVNDATIEGDQYVGGLLGFSSFNPSTFDEMYVSATVESSTSGGAVVGRIGDDGGGTEGIDQFPDVYWDEDVESTEYVGEFTSGAEEGADRQEPIGLSTDEMVGDAAEANMDGFNFDDRWATRTSPQDYPSFTWEVQTPDSPNAVITIPTTTLEEGESISISAEDSDGGDGEITAYEWDFDDGSDASGESVQHTYTDPGEYTVELTVEGPTGIATDTVDISVIDGDATDFTVNPSTVEVGEEVEFSSVDGNEYTWEFGDGTTAVGADPVHTYDSPGTYSVTIDPESEAVTREVVVTATEDIRITDIDPEYTGPVVEGLDVTNEYNIAVDSERDVESVVLEIDGSTYEATHESGQTWSTTIDLSVVEDDTLLNITATDDLGREATAEDAIRYNPSPEWLAWMLENAENTERFTEDDIAAGAEFTLVDGEAEVNQLPGSPWEEDFKAEKNLTASAFLLAPEGHLQLGVDGSGEVVVTGVGAEITGGGSGEIDEEYQLVLVTAELGGEVRAPVWQAGFNPPVVDRQNVVVYGVIAVDTTAEFEGDDDGIQFNEGVIAPEGGLEARTTIGVDGVQVQATVDGRVGGEADFTLDDTYLQTANLTANSDVEGEVELAYLTVEYGPRELYSSSMTVLDPGGPSTATIDSVEGETEDYEWEVADKHGTQPEGASTVGIQTSVNSPDSRITDRTLEDTHPSTTTVGDETVVIWSRQNETKDVTDGRDLAVSVNDGSWAETTSVTDDTTHNEYPDVGTLNDDSASLVAWERLDTTQIQANTPEELLPATEVAIATADGDSPADWSDPELLSEENDETLTHQPVVAANDTHWLVAWERNDANDPQTFDSRSVEYALVSPTDDGITVTERNTIENAMRPDVSERGDGGFSLGYYEPEDETTAGNVVQATIDRSGTAAVEDTYAVEVFGDLTVSQERLAWSEGTGVTEKLQYVQGDSEPTALELSGEISDIDDVELTVNNNRETLTYRGTPGDDSTRDIVYRFKQDGEWSADQRIAGGDDNLTVWHADTTPVDNTFQTAYAAQPFGTEGINDIFIETQAIEPRHTITAVSDEEVAVGEEATIEYRVQNVGISSDDPVEVELVANGEVKQTESVGPLSANESVQGSFEETVSDTGEFDVRIGGVSRNVVTAQASEDEPWLPTSSTVSVATPALGVGQTSTTVTESTSDVTVNVSNAGNATANDVPVAILSGSTEIANKTIASVEPNSQESATFDIDPSAVDDQQIESVVIDQDNTLPDDWIAERGQSRNTWLFQPDLSIDGSVSYQNISGSVFAGVTLSNAGDRATPATISLRNSDGEIVGEQTIQIGSEPDTKVFENAYIRLDDLPSEDEELSIFVDSPVPDKSQSTTAKSDTFGPVVDSQPEDAEFAVSVSVDSDTVTEGETLNIEYTITNLGREPAAQTVVGTHGQNELFESDISLNSNETITETTTYTPSSDDVGTIEIGIETEDTIDTESVSVVADTDDSGSSGGGGAGGGGGVGSGGGVGGGAGATPPSTDSPDAPEGLSVVDSVSQPIEDDNPAIDGTAVTISDTTLESIRFTEDDLNGSVEVFEVAETPEDAPALNDDQPFVSGYVINVPDELSDESAILTASIPSEQIEDAGVNASELVVLHARGDEYEQLETSVETDESITVSAETPGFSTFVISTSSQVEESDDVADEADDTADTTDDTTDEADDTADTTDATTDDADDTTTVSDERTDGTDDEIPGFGVVAALLALLAAVLRLTRR